MIFIAYLLYFGGKIEFLILSKTYMTNKTKDITPIKKNTISNS